MAGECRIAGFSILCYFFLLLSSIDAQVTIMTQPLNVTVCLSQTTTANFTCVVDAGSTGITNVGWQILIEGGSYTSVIRRPRHMLDFRMSATNSGTIITETLTVTDVSLNDNGAKYRCQPVDDVISDVVTLTVIAAPPYITGIEVDEKCAIDLTVSWTPASNEEGLSYNVTLSLQSGVIIVSDLTMNTSYNFTGLIPNTEYNVSIASVLHSCTGTPNTIMDTTVEAGVPSRVPNFGRPDRSRNGITIEWDPADSPNCGPVLYYIVTIVNAVNANDRNITLSSVTRAEFSNLINGTFYNISVAAVNRAGSGPEITTIVSTLTDEEVPNVNGGGGSGGLSGGAIAGIVIGIIVAVGIVIIILIIVFLCYRKMQNKDGIISSNSSPDPSSPNKKKAASNEPKGKATKASKQKDKQANKTEYAELQLSSTGTAPSVDPTKVDYTAVKEHEPLSYAEVQHDTRAGEKPIQGAPQVEYKEVWHQ